jgi:hypothetical protein
MKHFCCFTLAAAIEALPVRRYLSRCERQIQGRKRR